MTRNADNRDYVATPPLCPMCGAIVERNTRGRPRIYCSGMCRARAYMARHYQINIFEIIEAHGDICYLCHDVVNLDEPFGPKMPNVDHVVPLGLGGANDLHNLRVVHYACNLRKSSGFVCPHCAQPI